MTTLSCLAALPVSRPRSSSLASVATSNLLLAIRCQLPPANPNAPPPPRRPLMLCARGSPCWASWGAVGSRSHTRPRYTRGLLKRQANCCSQVQHTWAERQGSGVWSRTKCGRWPARQQSGGPLRRGCDLPLRQGVGVDFEYRVARAAPLSRPSRRCRATAGVAATVNSPSRLPPRAACAPAPLATDS